MATKALAKLRAAVDTAQEKLQAAEAEHVDRLHAYQVARMRQESVDRRRGGPQLMPDHLWDLLQAVDQALDFVREAEAAHVAALHEYQLAHEQQRTAHRDRQGQQGAAAIASGQVRGVMDGSV
jgi:hypothetical protein